MKHWSLTGILELVLVGTEELKLLAREWMRKKWASDSLIPSFRTSEEIIRRR